MCALEYRAALAASDAASLPPTRTPFEDHETDEVLSVLTAKTSHGKSDGQEAFLDKAAFGRRLLTMHHVGPLAGHSTAAHNGQPSAPTIGVNASALGVLSGRQATLAGVVAGLGRILRTGGASDFDLEGSNGLIANLTRNISAHLKGGLLAATDAQATSCTGLFGVVDAARTGASKEPTHRLAYLLDGVAKGLSESTNETSHWVLRIQHCKARVAHRCHRSSRSGRYHPGVAKSWRAPASQRQACYHPRRLCDQSFKDLRS